MIFCTKYVYSYNSYEDISMLYIHISNLAVKCSIYLC